MKVGNFQIGKRHSCNHKFHFFYCPLASWDKEQFWFFWWFGRNWYVSLVKSEYKDKRD